MKSKFLLKIVLGLLVTSVSIGGFSGVAYGS